MRVIDRVPTGGDEPGHAPSVAIVVLVVRLVAVLTVDDRRGLCVGVGSHGFDFVGHNVVVCGLSRFEVVCLRLGVVEIGVIGLEESWSVRLFVDEGSRLCAVWGKVGARDVKMGHPSARLNIYRILNDADVERERRMKL